jgi:hypothetical protein
VENFEKLNFLAKKWCIFLKETTSLNYGAVILNYGRCHCVFTPKSAYFGVPVALKSHGTYDPEPVPLLARRAAHAPARAPCRT